MNERKTHKSTQRRHLHLGWAQPQELQPPKKAQSWYKVKFISITQKIIMSQNYLQQNLKDELKCKAALKCEKQLFNL